MGRTSGCCECKGARCDWLKFGRDYPPLVAGNLSMVANRDNVRGRSRAREIHVRLDLPSRIPSRHNYGNQGKSRFRPDTHSRILDPIEVCSSRDYFLD